MVIEAVFEDIKIKHAVLKEVEAVSRLKKNLVGRKTFSTSGDASTIVCSANGVSSICVGPAAFLQGTEKQVFL